jgi:peptidoglycan/LPS O-acetylase OafA/YrhL
MSARIPFLDALRGVLACIVVTVHIALAFDCRTLVIPGLLAVIGFFLLSGYVLARGYDGDPATFIVRRMIRLWPVYAICVCVGAATQGFLPSSNELLWLSFPAWGSTPVSNPPAWSLYYEAWATLAFPLVFRLATMDRRLGWVLATGIATLGLLDFRCFLASFFVVGATLAQYEFHIRQGVPAWSIWIGKVSFSLYLTHQVILSAAETAIGPWGAVYALPFLLPVAWVTWWGLERHSTNWSRCVVLRPMVVQKKLASATN